MGQYEADPWAKACIHGNMFPEACTLCNGKEKIPGVKKPKKQAVSAKAEQEAKPECIVCAKKALRSLGHVGHRRYRPLFDSFSKAHGRNPKRPVDFVEVRAIFKATHKDDKGKDVCDQCCQRCTRCKSPEYRNVSGVEVLMPIKVERVSVNMRTVSAEQGAAIGL